jgi:glutamate/aspartate transport system substrate-binding protein
MRGLLTVACLLLLVPAAVAQDTPDQPAGNAFTGVLKRLHDRGSVVIGYRESAFPFSFMLGSHPAGYTIDLCLGVVDELSRVVDRDLRVRYMSVAAEARLDAVTGGRIDLECSSTTATFDRHRVVAFSPVIFVAGTKLLVARVSTLRSARDLGGRTVAVVAGTTNEQVVRNLVARAQLSTKIVAVPDLDAALALVRDGEADAMASDDVLLHGLIARAQPAGVFRVIGEFLSYEPYGIMFAKDDPALADVVGRAFARMAADRDLLEIYDRWFRRPTPGTPALNLPMSVQLAEMFRLLGSDE